MRSRKKTILVLLLLVLAAAWFFSLPRDLFVDPVSSVLEDRKGNLLSATIASDGQWRFPVDTTLPPKFVQLVVLSEDKRFWSHPGVDILALARAAKVNLAAGRVVSGGSTLSMQVIRLSRKHAKRTFFEKFIECVMATRLEFRYSKREILSLYAAHAPFGGNVVGVEAACWRYFRRPPDGLSWAEAALLAVLPNNPSWMHLSRNRTRLKEKRDRLLRKLQDAGGIDSDTYRLSVEEPIPDGPHPLPGRAPHLLQRIRQSGEQGRFRSSIQPEMQARAESVMFEAMPALQSKHIFNGAALLLDVKTGEVLAYVGNIPSGNLHGEQVDIIQSRRSTGSILKPFLYAAMMDDGRILPKSLVPDIPLHIQGFSPKNFSGTFEGSVPADLALVRSLNVPSVVHLREYHYERFHDLLRRMGMTTLTYDPDHYGLSLVLGGAEGTLWDITGMYASAARILNNYFERPGSARYSGTDIHSAVLKPVSTTSEFKEVAPVLTAGSLGITMEVLRELSRPDMEAGWRHFSGSRPIAWKTGTSFGNRDGWAIGVTPEYALGVWVGNADGEGRPGLTGMETAAPLLFRIFSQLEGTTWFRKPQSELVRIVTCRRSGFRATSFCEQRDTTEVVAAGRNVGQCTFHRRVHLTPDRKYQVHSDCFPLDKSVEENWFVLPPLQAYYYQLSHAGYRSLPPFKQGCQPVASRQGLEIVYPGQQASILVPRGLDGQTRGIILKAAYHHPDGELFWHLDGVYLSATRGKHDLVIYPEPGRHTLTVVDDGGASVVRTFTVLASGQK